MDSNNIYLYYFVVAIVYLGLTKFWWATKEVDEQSFWKVKDIYHWMKYLLLLLAVYYTPPHTVYESGVALLFCLALKWLADRPEIEKMFIDIAKNIGNVAKQQSEKNRTHDNPHLL